MIFNISHTFSWVLTCINTVFLRFTKSNLFHMNRKSRSHYIRANVSSLIFLLLSLKYFINQVPDINTKKINLEIFFFLSLKKHYLEFIHDAHLSDFESSLSSRKITKVIIEKNASNSIFLSLENKNGSNSFNSKLSQVKKEAFEACSTYISLSNVYVSGRGAFCINDTYIKLDEESEKYYSQRNGTLVYKCDELIHCAGMLSRTTWGHVIIDLMSATLYIPEAIRRKSYVVGAITPAYYNEALKIIGFEDWQIISIEPSEWIHANTFHTVIEPRAYVNHFGFTLKEIYNMSVKLYHTDLIKSTRLCLMNRDKRYNKHFLNFKEIVSCIKKQWPHYKWEIIPDHEKNMEQTVKLFASIKFLFCALGSNSIKCIFMHPHSIIVGGLSNTIERVTFSIAIVNDLYLSAFAVPGMLHWGHSVYINIELAMKGMRVGISMLEKGQWPTIS